MKIDFIRKANVFRSLLRRFEFINFCIHYTKIILILMKYFFANYRIKSRYAMEQTTLIVLRTISIVILYTISDEPFVKRIDYSKKNTNFFNTLSFNTLIPTD